MYKNVLLDIQGRIATLTINRPKALNALNQDTLLDIKAAVEEVHNSAEVDVLIITGAGDKAFVAGADITAMVEMTAIEGRAFGQLGGEVTNLMETMPKPVIASINGFCLGGGCELAMACDFRICSHKSKFGQPEVGLGVTPGFGGTQRLPRLVGSGMAKQLLYTGDVIDAQEALRIGMVNQVVASEQLQEQVLKIAQRIVARGQLSVRFCKDAVNSGMQMDITRAMAFEADIFGLCFATSDQKEGMRAFMEKRKADFTGK
ncbi:MAG: enoyl-CoA hydratase-related protein [Syntrophomonas sp.]